ncbi:MAG: HlyC/CorC family transporter [Chlamydiales bacterium]|nr:HlyC/CorC family transporter [Chlamydiales bacterium]
MISLLILLFVFTLGSGFFSLSQIALFSLSSTELKIYKQSSDQRKQLIASVLSRPRDLLVTLLFCDIGANILIQNTSANFFGVSTTWFLKVGVPLVITLFIGEIIPKTLALSYNKPIAMHVVRTVALLEKILGPLLLAMTYITTRLSHLLFFFLKREKEISKEELHHVLKSSESTGILSLEEAKLIEGYLSLTDYTVKERMHPRHEILYYDTSDPISKLIYLFIEKECSRVPVCDGDLQNMLGIIRAKTFFLHRSAIKTGKDLAPFLTKPYYVPETILARTLLHHFFYQEMQMGIVVDEYGSISGIITQEDLYEVVVGEIADRRDEKSRYTPAGSDVVITSGKFELSEFEHLFGVELPSENNMVTLGGWLTEQLGDIPKSGTKYEWDGFIFQILAADPNRVRRVYIRRVKDE